MPARVAEWQENESLIRIVVQNTGSAAYRDLVLSAKLTKDGRRFAWTRDGHREQPRICLSAWDTRTLTWQEAISERALEYDKSIEQVIATTGELPEGNYQLCLQVLDMQLRPVSHRQACGSFTVILSDPPQLIRPTACTRLPSTNTGIVSFQWTPSNPPAQRLLYRLTVKPRYRGQTPAQAMASNPVSRQVDVPTTLYTTTMAEANTLGADAANPNYESHVWQVQALLNGRPYGRNRGQSQIECFVVPAIVAGRTGPVMFDNDGLYIFVNFAGYRELLSGRPVLLEPPEPLPQDSVMVVLHLQVPKHLSMEQIQRLLGKHPAPAYTLRVNSRYTGGFYVYGDGSDTSRAPTVHRYKGGFFVYSLPQDSTQPAVLQGFRKEMSPSIDDGPIPIVDWVTITPWSQIGRIERERIKLNEPVDIIGLRDERLHNTGIPVIVSRDETPAIVSGIFYPAELALPVMDIVVEADTPIDTAATSISSTAKYTGYVLQQATASGAGRLTGKTLGAVTRQANPAVSRGPRAVGLGTGDQVPPQDTTGQSGGGVICWLPPLEPGQPPVGVAGEVSDEGITFAFRASPKWLRDLFNRRPRVYCVMSGAVR